MDNHKYNVKRSMSQSIDSKIDSIMEQLNELTNQLIAIEQRLDHKTKSVDECDCPYCQESRD